PALRRRSPRGPEPRPGGEDHPRAAERPAHRRARAGPAAPGPGHARGASARARPAARRHGAGARARVRARLQALVVLGPGGRGRGRSRHGGAPVAAPASRPRLSHGRQVLTPARVLAVALALLGCARQPRSLLIVEIAAGDSSLSFAHIRVRAAGVERRESGEVPQKIGVYLPASVEGSVSAVVDGLDTSDVAIAGGTSDSVEIHPGETRSVTVRLAKLPGVGGADGGSPPD